MRITMDLDHGLLAEAQRLTGMTDHSALVQAGLRMLIEREGARHLVRLGGNEPRLEQPSRRRPGFALTDRAQRPEALDD
jgi:Arc/MetJ family transcription regulator